MKNKIVDKVIGILFILVGVIIALNYFEVIKFSFFFDGWWTLFLIVPSIVSVIKEGLKFSNILFLTLGIFMLLSSQNIIDFEDVRKLILPSILICIGGTILFNNKSKKTVEINEAIIDEDAQYSAIFGSQNISFDNKSFNGANVNAIFGGVELNLKNSIIDKDVIIDVSAIFGGVEIIVPNNVKVETSGIPIFGGISNKNNNVNDDKYKTIYVKSICMFGGVEIK